MEVMRTPSLVISTAPSIHVQWLRHTLKALNSSSDFRF
ncbi:Uncharacterised protein [Burkholderia pseudomallei]|nr:Uncharacterised protein [Burkholderia pseudomallei]CAJ3224897.1 Uncharacterised protein [Burkholderia pseudomallei]CAJ3247995.1 Uncharacterised protein [Burkholderia pseudomallei]CAJ3256313.1 Uncharacterised protein [Burkholderia pseudomallei]CAJ3258800.1 Uncharacterised protein [Burkholderia pseudomallei]